MTNWRSGQPQSRETGAVALLYGALEGPPSRTEAALREEEIVSRQIGDPEEGHAVAGVKSG